MFITRIVQINDIPPYEASDFELAEDRAAPRTTGDNPFLRPPGTEADPEKVERALFTIRHLDDYGTWFKVGCALHTEFGDEGFDLFDRYSAHSPKYNQRTVAEKWREISESSRGEITVGTIFHLATETDPEWDTVEQDPDGVTIHDFVAHLPDHSYIFKLTGAKWRGTAVDERVPKVGGLKPTKWLDRNRGVDQMTWAPGEPETIVGRLVNNGGWITKVGASCFNLYRPPTIVRGQAAGATRWREHIERIYPDEAEHTVQYLAHRVQKPGEKINHALLLGGSQGIGKDTLLEPVKYAVGPWNFQEVSPKQAGERFNTFLQSTVLRVSEMADRGETDRFLLYEHMKTYTASPPDVLMVDEKHVPRYPVFNCVGVIYTTNRKNAVYLPSDDRRTFVAWSAARKEDFPAEYWNELWQWYRAGGIADVAAYLAEYDLTGFDPKAPPPKTPVFWEIVELGRQSENPEMEDLLDALAGSPPCRPDAVTIDMMVQYLSAQGQGLGRFGELYDYLTTPRNRKMIPHRMAECGYVAVRNGGAQSGLWVVNGRRMVVYALERLTPAERLRAADRLRSSATAPITPIR